LVIHDPTLHPFLHFVRNVSYRLSWGNRAMYDWLMRIGLMPAKSDRLGEIAIPDQYLADFFRGEFDGDGSIQVYTDRWNTFKNEKYVYERLFISVVSASQPFLEWLHAQIKKQIPVGGAMIAKKKRIGRKPIWVLKFAKYDSIEVLNWMYYAPDLPCLERKYDKAKIFLSRD